MSYAMTGRQDHPDTGPQVCGLKEVHNEIALYRWVLICLA